MTSWLDDLLGKTVMLDGVSLPDRKRLNFKPTAGVSVVDNEALGSTDVTLVGPVSVATASTITASPLNGLQALLDLTPRDLYKYFARFNLPAGAADGITIRGFNGGLVDIVGSWVNVTPGSGLGTFTAGAGSGANLVNKQTASANWPNDNSLRGALVRVVGGGGYTGNDALTETVARIKSHTVNQLVLEGNIVGLDGTTQVVLVQEGTVFSTAAADTYNGKTHLVGVINCSCDVRLWRCKLNGSAADYGLRLDKSSLELHAVWLAACASYCAAGGELLPYSLRMSANALLETYKMASVRPVGLVGNAASLLCDGIGTFEGTGLWMNGDNGSNPILTLKNFVKVALGGDISGATSTTAVILHNIHNYATAGAVTGTNPGTTYFVVIDGGGQFLPAGMSGTGSEASSKYVQFEDGNTFQYAQLAAGGTVSLNGTFMKWAIGAETHMAGINVFVGQTEEYLQKYYLGNAYKEINIAVGDPAHTAHTQANAVVIGYRETKIIGAAGNGDVIRMYDDTTIGFGLDGVIWNRSGFSLALYPGLAANNRRFYLDGVLQGINATISIPDGKRVLFAADTAGFWDVVIL